MKDKRILAMFIVSVVTLVTSLAVTFGVRLTWADPVEATGIEKYEYVFASETGVNNSLISEGTTQKGKTSLSLKNSVVFQPSTSINWSEEPVWFDGTSYADQVWYADESISSSIKVIPLRVYNDNNKTTQFKLSVLFDNTTMLGKYTKVQIIDFKSNTTIETTTRSFEITANTSRDFAVIVYANDSANLGEKTIDWGTEYETINVKIDDITIS